MDYFQISPCNALSPFIKTYWFLEGKNGFAAPQVQRIFPDGSIELIIHYGDAFVKQKSIGSEQQRPAFIFGQLEQFIELIPSHNIGVMGVKFRPNGFSAFTNLPLITIKQQEIELQDLFGKDSKSISSKIQEANNAYDRVKIIEGFLLQHLNKSVVHRDISTFILSEIYRSSGLLSIGYLLNKYDLSEKMLERIFSQQVGLSPKTYSRIIRFQQVFKLAESSRNFTELALEAGYYDQAHFTREFRSFTGLSPRQYFNTAFGFTELFLDD